MQNQVARFVLTSRACNNVAACMPSLSVCPRMLSFLSYSLSDISRPTHVLSGLHDGLTAIQSVSCQHMPQLTPLTDRHSYAPALVPTSAACMPLMPAQLQAVVRAAQVQQLASMSPSIPGLEGELPSAVKGWMWKAMWPNQTTVCADAHLEAHTEEMLCATKRTYQPSVIIRKRRHGFLNRYTSLLFATASSGMLPC